MYLASLALTSLSLHARSLSATSKTPAILGIPYVPPQNPLAIPVFQPSPSSDPFSLVWDVDGAPYMVLIRNGTLSKTRLRRPDSGTADDARSQGER